MTAHVVAAGTPGADAFRLSNGRAADLWLWLRSARAARSSAPSGEGLGSNPPSVDAPAQRLAQARRLSEREALDRILEAFERSFERREGPPRTAPEPWLARLRRGLDPCGVALFSRWLEHQLAWWGAAGEAVPLVEREARAAMAGATRARLYGLLGEAPEVVCAWAQSFRLPLEGQQERSVAWAVTARTAFSGVAGLTLQSPDRSDPDWCALLATWVLARELPPLVAGGALAEPRPAPREPPLTWPLLAWATFEADEREAEQAMRRLPSSFVPLVGGAEETNLQNRAQFLSLFPERPSGVHARLSAPPDGAALANFVKELRDGSTEERTRDSSAHECARWLEALLFGASALSLLDPSDDDAPLGPLEGWDEDEEEEDEDEMYESHEPPTCSDCGRVAAEGECPHLVLLVDSYHSWVEGGALKESFSRRWNTIREGLGEDVQTCDLRDAFDTLLDELHGCFDGITEAEIEGGPGQSTTLVAYYAHGPSGAAEAKAKFLASATSREAARLEAQQARKAKPPKTKAPKSKARKAKPPKTKAPKAKPPKSKA